ncbi:MAG: hypothetical protein DI563_07680 [Variovorax paradoxus]|uniref:Uncharacterized protein n=1 Tax=Variovorax paradoxus TaxID=34073 RepID=A0A2W5QCP5_VARPD|nr:MAG: hypothetical protein DI563_07680 [Variovorax paradoxus]
MRTDLSRALAFDSSFVLGDGVQDIASVSTGLQRALEPIELVHMLLNGLCSPLVAVSVAQGVQIAVGFEVAHRNDDVHMRQAGLVLPRGGVRLVRDLRYVGLSVEHVLAGVIGRHQQLPVHVDHVSHGLGVDLAWRRIRGRGELLREAQGDVQVAGVPFLPWLDGVDGGIEHVDVAGQGQPIVDELAVELPALLSSPLQVLDDPAGGRANPREHGPKPQ